MERERDEEEQAEHEGSLEEALTNRTKVVRVAIDKWFVGRGLSLALAKSRQAKSSSSTGFLGAEVLMVGTDAWVQVLNDDVRAHGGIGQGRLGDTNVWKTEEDKERADKVAQQARRPAETDRRAGSPVREGLHGVQPPS